MPGQNDARRFGGGQINFEFNPYTPERLPPQTFERDPRRTPSPAHAGPSGHSSRFLPPIRTSQQYYHEHPHRPGPYRQERYASEAILLPNRYSYPTPAEENEWGRLAWRGPSWQDTATSQGFSSITWGRKPPSPQRRDMLAQPMLEPSQNWKQTHGISSDNHERIWPRDTRPPDAKMRDTERSPARGPPTREHYSHPVYLQQTKFKNLPHGSDAREPHLYGPRTDNYRPEHNNSPPWVPPAYPLPDQYGDTTEAHAREFQRVAHWEPRFSSPRTEYSKNFTSKRERTIKTDSLHNDEHAPAMYRDRSITQERSRFGALGPVTKWNSPPKSLIPAFDTSRSRPSKSHASPQRARSRSRSSSGSSRGHVHSPVRSSKYSATGKADEHLSVPPTQKLNFETAANHTQLPSSSTRPDHITPSLEFTRRPSPSSATQTPDLERIVKYDWPDSSSTSILPALSANTASPQDIDENAVARLLEPERGNVTENMQVSTPIKLYTHNASRPVSPTTPTQVSPEPDVPLALQSTVSKGAQPTPSIPITPTGESLIDLGDPPSSPTALEHTPPDIPSMPIYEALRVIVMVRLQQQVQTQEERVNPILMANLSKVEPVLPSATTPMALVREVSSGAKFRTRTNAFESTKSSLEVRFAKRQWDLSEKVHRLRTEYLALHEQWIAHCAKLDEVAKNLALQEAAATAGRTTRRSMATMGDAVRSDLEMEQIIASLGNEELTDANHLGARNAAMIPDMISVEVGDVEYAFDDTNNEVYNPAEYYAPRTGTDDWTEEEVSIFVEKFAQTPKQFGIIADSLPHKTAAQCVTFYYLHKNKHIDFRKVVASRIVKRKRGGRKQKSNALLADIRQKDDETATPPQRKRTALLPVQEPKRPPRRSTLQFEHTPTATPTPEPELEPRKRRGRITARASGQDEDEVNNDEEDTGTKPAKRGKRTRKPRLPSNTPLSTPTIMEDNSPFANTLLNDYTESMFARGTHLDHVAWSNSDITLLGHLLSKYKEDYERIAALMPNKSATQIFQFCQARGAELRHSSVAMDPALSDANMWMPPSSSSYEPYGHHSHPVSSKSAPVSSNQLPLDQIHTPYGASRSYATFLPRDTANLPSFPHPTQYAANTAMSHLGSISTSSSGDPITNPSPFTIPSTFSEYSLNNSELPYPTATPTRSDETLSRPNAVDGRDPAGSQSGNASMAFDATPNFVPPPQTWSLAPLGTTDDLVAYLEHRTRLAKQH
ncbi:hypothetical protein BC835DRAFT_838895 [Cytidiella melzeri]|nr:hypothetical protein BC835DRAFT_838895 [Cytidiella melzeri]